MCFLNFFSTGLIRQVERRSNTGNNFHFKHFNFLRVDIGQLSNLQTLISASAVLATRSKFLLKLKIYYDITV